MKQAIYSVGETKKFIDHLVDKGWDCVCVAEGCCGIGDWICIAPDDRHYNFIINEVYLNAWSSGQTVRRQAKLSKQNLARLNKAEQLELCY